MSSYVAVYIFGYPSWIYIYKCPLSICSSLHYINTHCFFFNHTLLLYKNIVVAKQIFSSHKNPDYNYEKKKQQQQQNNI